MQLSHPVIMWQMLSFFGAIFLVIQTPWLGVLASQGRCPRQVIHLTGQQGTIQSPSYPQNYSPKQTCVWHIKVDKGYKVHLNFASQFEVRESASCADDYVVVSTRTQRFDSPPVVQPGKYSVVFCGSRTPSNVTSARNELWVRFHAKRGNAKGFRAFYGAQDIDECVKANGGCQHECVNTPGNYECTCPVGFVLQQDGNSCQKVQQISFTKKRYRAAVPIHAPVLTSVVTVQATGGNSDVKRFYSILKIDGRPPGVSSLFTISRKSGSISIHRKLTKPGRHRLLVEARSPDGSRVETTVVIRVLSSNGNNLRFASPLYSVIIPEILPRGRVILHLKVIKSGELANATVSFSLPEPTTYFRLNSQNGALKISKSLSGLVTGKKAKSFVLHVIAVSRGKVKQRASTQVSIVVVPEYAGNPYVHSALEAINNQSSTKRSTQKQRDRSNSVATEFSLHRLFRKPSAEAQRISKADMKFGRVVSEIKRRVAKSVISGDRLRTDAVSVRLGPDSLASTSKLADLIKELNCSQPTANCTDSEYHAKYRTFDGTCNNLENPIWGAASTAYSRMLGPVYFDEDGMSDPVGFPDQPFAPDMPSAHLVSREFFIHRSKATRNEKKYSHMLMQWGQFLDHDISFTAESDGAQTCFLPNCDGSLEDYEPPCFPIRYPDSDQCTMFTRSAAACQSDDENITPREQLNTITSFIDGSQIYGSSEPEANNLRDFVTNKGYLRTSSADLLPFIKSPLKPPLNFCQLFGGCFDAGDFRVNEQIALASMHTLWVREHNRIAHELHHANKHWNQEKIFQEARKIIGAKLQHITYTEYLPKILGKDAIPPYQGYLNTNPSVMNGFAAAAFRFGHSSVRPAFDLLNESFTPIAPAVPLIKAFFNNKLVQAHGIEPILLGLLANVSQTTNREIADGLTKHLFQQPESEHGFDLVALNVQRGRDHGLPGYGVWRRECNLSHAEIFEETNFEIKDPKVRQILKDLYDDDVETADLFVAGLAEEPVSGATVGPTFHCIIREQFLRLREGDRFWYENTAIFSPAQINEIKKVTLSQVLCDNINGVVSVQDDAFVAASDNSKRRECSQFHRIDLSHWKENHPSPSAGEWSSWVNTVRTPTGSWAVALGQQVCLTSIVNIECQLADGSPLATAQQVVHCKPFIGFYCRNREQRTPGEKCKDYRFRFLCSSIPKPVPSGQKLSRFFTSPSNPYSQCDVERHPSDFPLTFEATQHVTIHQPYETHSSDDGCMFAGKNIGEPRKRFLLKFNTGRIPRRAIIHSAFLHIYLMDFGRSGSSSGDETIAPNELEAYQVISTDWQAENTTSVIPWHENYLGIGTDVSQHRLSVSDQITAEDQRRWVSVDIQHAIRNWQIRHQANFGIMLKSKKEASANGLMRFASSSHETVTLRPKLIVCLTIPPW